MVVSEMGIIVDHEIIIVIFIKDFLYCVTLLHMVACLKLLILGVVNRGTCVSRSLLVLGIVLADGI